MRYTTFVVPFLRRQEPMDEPVLFNDKRLPSPPIVLVEASGGGVGVKAAKPDRTGQRDRHDCQANGNECLHDTLPMKPSAQASCS